MVVVGGWKMIGGLGGARGGLGWVLEVGGGMEEDWGGCWRTERGLGAGNGVHSESRWFVERWGLWMKLWEGREMEGWMERGLEGWMERWIEKFAGLIYLL